MTPQARHAEALANELDRRGMSTTVYATGQFEENPCVKVFSERSEMFADVYLVLEEGGWAFWWQTDGLERIGPVGELVTAADRVEEVIHVQRIRPVRGV